MFCVSQTPEQQEPDNYFHHLHHLHLFPHQTKEDDMATHQSKEFGSKGFSKKKISNFNLRVLPYLQMEEKSKHLQFKSLISEKVGPHLKILDQPNWQDINCLCHMILVIMAPEFEKTLIIDFKPG